MHRVARKRLKINLDEVRRQLEDDENEAETDRRVELK